MKNYDNKNKNSILNYTKLLNNKTVNEVLNENNINFVNEDIYDNSIILLDEESPIYNKKKYKGKGGFGNFLEEVYFNKKNDSKSQPDFPEAGVELKVSPLKILKNNQIRVKERLVLNHFKYSDIVNESFDESHFLYKASLILIVFYFYENNKELGNLRISFSDFWECLKEDEAQIREDWETIVNKIKKGKAHEISEGDTLYIGACTKGATAKASMQSQPYSDILARGRALCFKTNYINQIYIILKERQTGKILQFREFKNKNTSLKVQVLERFNPYISLDAKNICDKLNISYNPKAKGFYSRLSWNILGFKKKCNNIFEFKASGLQLKTIRLEPNLKFKESISFPAFDYCDILNEKWEDSTFYTQITSQFIFIIFKHDDINVEYHLDKILFWNVPEKDLETIHNVWKDTRKKIKDNNYDNFIKLTDRQKVHVRPHDTKGSKPMLTPQGYGLSRKSFWLNKSYIQEEVINKIYKTELKINT